ncbi:hypothetical protein MtrunA17_Chr7g0233781 [Medicago truncatula]|uniref:Uncharacterized protein n=1 Tax=Medicago truncatula TaxID=3880 RepID=A0A396GYV5_MEDTR|nr:hypothetical protein MtrunA17_Chr7g0233781 [Medicago truncatula]
MITWPSHSLTGTSTCSTIHVLSVIQCLQKVLTSGIPFSPSCWVNVAVHDGLQHNGPGVFFPWAA